MKLISTESNQDFSVPFFDLLYSASSLYFRMDFLGLVANWDLD